MAMAEENILQIGLKRFPPGVREELNNIVHHSSWQALKKEFSVDVYTGVQPEALDLFPHLVDSRYKEFREDVRVRMEILKVMKTGDLQSLRGKSKVGFQSYFYRFWILCKRRPNGLYDIAFAYTARNEEFDLFLSLTKAMKGSVNAIASAPPLAARLSQEAYRYIHGGVFGGDEEPSPANHLRESPYTDLTQALGDCLADYQMVEDLIERGMLAENEDGTLYIQFR